MSTLFDITLINKYRNLFGLNNLLYSPSLSKYDSSLVKNITINSILTVSQNSIINNSISNMSNIYLDNNLTVSGNTICLGNINCINNSINQNIISNNFNVSNNSYLNNVTIISNLQGFLGLLQNLTINSNLNISNNAILLNITGTNNLYISSQTFINNITINSSLYISNTTLLNNASILSNLYVAGSVILNTTTINSNLSINNTTIINNNTNLSDVTIKNAVFNNTIIKSCTLLNNLNVSGMINLNVLNVGNQINGMLSEYTSNENAIMNGVPINRFYRTGGIIKICTNTLQSILILSGTSPLNLYLGDTFIDPGAYSTDQSINTIQIKGTVTPEKAGSYIRYYTAIDSNNNIVNTLSRTINIFNYPIITGITLSVKQIIVTISGNYNIMTYYIMQNNTTIINETQTIITTIDVSSLTSSLTPYIITINLKRSNNNILTSSNYSFIIP